MEFIPMEESVFWWLIKYENISQKHTLLIYEISQFWTRHSYKNYTFRIYISERQVNKCTRHHVISSLLDSAASDRKAKQL